MKIQRDYGVPEAANKLETIQAKLKYDNIQPRKKEFDNVMLKQNVNSSDGTHDLTLNNSLVVVRIYLPFSTTLKKLSRRGDKLKCSHEIVALTSNLLSELRDQILCASDNGLCVDIDDLKARPVSDVKLEYPSGLIGIDDVLYVDMRASNAVDYSEVIKQWGVQKNIAKFKVVQMDQVSI
ncbi:hypothetical protein AMK59_7000 [Oryctes borbonicus]|uniref:snRNA-activating protein complex subunit 3 n=1 Tax=Oryctes borbonicus TaxID=1629725 RepID=A0A0T6AZA8_9SCAR|nr:hypothetical protein AMK59_7000 [Oryctes borbonicus]